MMIGKVHGGLSRAGKVKGQTPKVEPKEKRKPKVGRSKTRLLYAKRYLNDIYGPGKKMKGYNTQLQAVAK
jgi:small subunit ribosomal protein S30e